MHFTGKTCFLATTQKEDQNLVFKTAYCLMQVKSIAQCSKAILSTSIRLPFAIKTLVFCLFLSGRLRQVLLY